MKRYRLGLDCDMDSDGEWVRFEDVSALVAFVQSIRDDATLPQSLRDSAAGALAKSYFAQ